jgi:hypothetical protein
MMTREYDGLSFRIRKEGERVMDTFVQTGCRFKKDDE